MDFFEADSEYSSSSLDNVTTIMPSDDAFDMWAYVDAPPTRKKSSRQNPGEGSGEPSRKRARPEDPQALALSKSTTPPPPPLTAPSTNKRRAEEVDAKHAKEIKACEEKIKAAEDKVTNLTEELKKRQEELGKVVAAKEKFKEASETNYKEASKLQEDLEASMKEATSLEEQNNPEANFDYLPEQMRQAKLAKCAACQEEERNAQNASDSSKMSLATSIDGVEEDAGTSVDQQSQQDPPPAA
ncbi:actin cytoskeleton-regulatory complex protein PAN1-like [Humulus lupulus]|uniref:actin cytoskeleton-regulatory complex protein PAN1-like n=1 Tax=Humulus lupulus TaxID=3486 RepID=UPI002B4006DD|nr:actin cytoskeleton-regulatory complex protein PAN1-like [Humulus lupulus]